MTGTTALGTTMMADLVGLLILLLSVAYAGFVGWCFFGFIRGLRGTVAPGVVASGADAHSLGSPNFVSVIVPARNEEKTIKRCLTALLASDYPREAFEIVVVDDQSTDATAARVAEAYPSELDAARIRVVSTNDEPPADISGKQHALDVGIAAARGNIILTTDADCTVGSGWVRAMSAAVAAGRSAAAGPIRSRLATRAPLFHRFQALELSGLLGVGAGSMALGHPTICSSASLGYTRALYEAWRADIGQGSAVGTDETIVHVAADVTGSPPRFVLDANAIVEADPNDHLVAFLQQRARWASMGGRYPAPRVVAISASIFLLFVLFVLAPVVGVVLPWVVAVLLKVSADGCLLFVSTRFLHPDKRLIPWWPVAEIFHAPYIVLVSLIGALAPVRWKR